MLLGIWICLECFEFGWNSVLFGMLGNCLESGLLGMLVVCLEFEVALNAWSLLGIDNCLECLEFN